ncbi:superoxide dismutase [Paludifilum halophilum]|uniref:superoxide dismutase n=1 Tax=Paludifilum halophilum TaxID=1642702 RepID=A0A235BCM0_9BACL|nr:superoxide dismutase [Paludifilum halophilum]OYD09809.1 superoxide dismutase [Paludifilum halophilum]
MLFYPDPEGDQLRRNIIEFARRGRRALSESSLKTSGEEELLLSEQNHLASRLKKLEQEASYYQPEHLYILAEKAGKTRRQLTNWLNRYFSQQANLSSENCETHSEKDDIPVNPVPIGKHVLPPLPYPYNALEPYIDEKTMRLHHDKHHKSYVEGLNKAERMMAKARKTGDFELIKHWEREAAFNGAGHYLHTIFWDIMSPDGGGKPTGELARQIQRDFGSFEAFKKHFSAAADKVEGGGWAILVWSPRSHRLEILQAEKHQNLSQWDVIPLLVLDVWEHAYYLKYPNNRKKYIDAWWNVVNWPAVHKRYMKARKLRWKPY